MEIPLNGFKGLYEGVSPVTRPIGVLSSVSNLILDSQTVLTTRPGLTLLGAKVAAATVNGLHTYYNETAGTSKLLAHVGTGLYEYNETTGVWGSSIGTLANAKSTSANINDLLIIVDGTNVKKWNGAAFLDLGGSPPTGKYIVAAYAKLFITGIATRLQDIDNCDDSAPEVWTPAANNNAASITMGYKEGDLNLWLALDDDLGKVLVWGKNGAMVLHGPDTPNRPFLWNPQKVFRYGTPNGRTIQNMGWGWVWLSYAGFIIWNGGNVRPIIEPIRESFKLIDWNNIASACSWQDQDGRYWCSLLDTSGVVKYFCVDEAGNWITGTGKDIRSSCLYRFTGKEIPVVGDKDGYVYKVEGTTDAGIAIDWSAIIGPSVLGISNRKKELTQIDVSLSLAAGATANAAISMYETGTFGSDKSITAGTTLTTVELPGPFGYGQPTRSQIFRWKIHGSGQISLYDAALILSESGV